MKELKFKCTLLSDVILNRKSASTGPNETLDFIPGSNFLGIVASKLYAALSPAESLIIFHSGKVRYGDAHPSLTGFRALRVPASMYYPKLSGPESELFIHHLIPEDRDMSDRQLKQCRCGFYDFSGAGQQPTAFQVMTETAFAVKSAYYRKERRSKDEQLFGYQSLRKGLTMYFSVEIDDDAIDSIENLEKKIEQALVGERQIGRSRSAQYGLVRIEAADYDEISIGAHGLKNGKHQVAVYADSRLIFLDEYGLPTFQPTADMLGLKGEIDWEKSQIRTFRYAPWNFKRQSFDTDRCGIEKGSVFVVNLPESFEPKLYSHYIGAYVNEGFGRVVYNPSFLEGDINGNAIFRLNSDSKENKQATNDGNVASDIAASPLLRYLKDMKKRDRETIKATDMVNEWTLRNTRKFTKGDFASQWGNIRSLAISASDISEIKKELFAAEPEPTGYLVHGIAKEKWAGERLKLLKEFVNDAERALSPITARLAIVNLASEMAKKIRQKS